jgi:hypothetical protein
MSGHLFGTKLTLFVDVTSRPSVSTLSVLKLPLKFSVMFTFLDTGIVTEKGKGGANPPHSRSIQQASFISTVGGILLGSWKIREIAHCPKCFDK